MHAPMLFVHVLAAFVWMGGMFFMLFALRPALAIVEPPLRLQVVLAVSARFFVAVAASIVLLLATGGWMLAQADAPPRGWHAMAAIGGVMMFIFVYIALVPYRQLKQAVQAQAWPAGGAAANRIALLAKVNLALGTLAIAAVTAWH